jgi:CRP-like cAMP-binding protein
MEQMICNTEKIKDGEYIIEEGTWAFYAYVLQYGKAKVMKNIHGRQVLIGTLKKGDLFGDMAFLGGTKRTASVIADGDVEVGLIPGDTFMEAISQLPSDTRAKLNSMVSDLTCISEVCAHLLTRLRDIEALKARMINMKDLEKGIEKLPELLSQVTSALVQRLNLAVERCTQLAVTIEEAVKPVDSLSVTLNEKSR